MALYFCAADAVLIAQVLYYNYMNSRKIGVQPLSRRSIEDSPDQPLLASTLSDVRLPGSRRRSSASQKHVAAISSFMPRGNLRACHWLKNILSVIAVCALGWLGWFIAFSAGFWKPTPGNPEDSTHYNLPAQTLGYLSAVRSSSLFMHPILISAYMDRYCTSGKYFETNTL